MTKVILIADDEPQLRLLVRITLEDDDYAIYEAEDGQQALELAEKVSPDLFLLDNMMPGYSGIEVCQRLRMNPKFIHHPIIMLTAKSQQHDIAAGKTAGVDHYLIKPFSPLELMHLVEEVLS
ncbi:response regulator [Leptolyngbya sp. FACHB-321]|uniref:response regulator transcription factor n=1 Tax=Leptolyngbya sp. FACHB-321 TaxID=2692807 RepID=UPI001681F82C|nr:response regulator [Leptolyngbya sp. FACHB-321]MBD2036436.1 response regulator [Leptolyngbya sp. FACHB-321]